MNKILSGFGRVNSTPPLGTPIVGYYNTRFTEGVLDELYTNAVAFEVGGQSALVISLPVCEMSTEQCNMFRAEIAKSTGVGVGAIFLNCSHTHTGGQLGSVGSLGEDICCPEYEAKMVEDSIAAANAALADLKPTKMSFAEGKAEGISFIRRFRMKDGGVQTNPGVDDPNIDYALGTPGEATQLLLLEREGGDDIYVVCYGTHADTVGGNYISGDWPGFVVSTIEGAIPSSKCIFLTGAQGDVNHINPKPTLVDRRGLEYDTFDGVPRGYEHAKHMGRVVAGGILAVAGKTVDIKPGQIKFGTKEILIPAHKENDRADEARALLELYNNGRQDEIPFKAMELTTVVAEANRIINMLNGPEAFPFVITAIAIGDFVLLGIPGELFVELGRKCEAISTFGATFVCCLTNGGDCYFPTESAYDEGGYEARSSFLDRSVEKILLQGVSELFEELK